MPTPETTTQIQVQLENTPGTLAGLAETLADEGINIEGFAVAEDGSTGEAFLVTSDPREASEILDAQGFDPTTEEIVFLPAPNEPGQLATAAGALGGSGVNIENAYVAADPSGNDLGFGFHVDDVKQATKVLRG
jgi:hypothetical protein